MEKAILKTLIYAEIFEYPMLAYEIQKWLIGEVVTLQQVEKALGRLIKKGKVKTKNGYFFLNGRERLVAKRLNRENQSKKYFLKANLTAWFLKLIPWIKLVGIDDNNLFIIVSKNRLWISRFSVINILQSNQILSKLHINILIDESRLGQENKNIYAAYKTLQMKPLWYREGIYSKYLNDNVWVFDFLPNWIGETESLTKKQSKKNNSTLHKVLNPAIDVLENIAMRFQTWYMKYLKQAWRMEDGILYFHPDNSRSEVLKTYNQKVKLISSTVLPHG